MQIISRKEAKALGLKRFFTGKPCKHGHVCERSVRDGECFECRRLYKRAWRAANPGMEREQQRRYRAADPEKFRARAREAARTERARAQKRERRKANIEIHRERDRKWAAANRDRNNASARSRRAADPEKYKELNRRHREKNRDKINKRNRERHAANPEIRNSQARVRRWANIEKARAASRESVAKWRAANPELSRELQRKWRAEPANREYLRVRSRRVYWNDPELARELVRDEKNEFRFRREWLLELGLIEKGDTLSEQRRLIRAYIELGIIRNMRGQDENPQ